MIDHIYKHTRLYLNAPFAQSAEIPLAHAQIHYLRNVLRKESGDILRVFNAQHGEWTARLEMAGKKNGHVVLEQCFKVQPKPALPRHLYFSPIKKQRMDMLIEKSVELGVTDLHPVLMNRTVMRKINKERIDAQIIEAAEQSERLDIPALHDALNLDDVLRTYDHRTPLYACLERSEKVKPITSFAMDQPVSFLIGPEGGFDEGEMTRLLKDDNLKPIGLGDTILRAETAAIACLSYAALACLCETKKN